MMVHKVKTCHAHDSLNVAAQIMWECACGCVPIGDEQRRPLGFLTDGISAWAAYTQGVPLQALPVAAGNAPKPELTSGEKAHLFTHALTTCHMDAFLRGIPEARRFWRVISRVSSPRAAGGEAY